MLLALVPTLLVRGNYYKLSVPSWGWGNKPMLVARLRKHMGGNTEKLAISRNSLRKSEGEASYTVHNRHSMRLARPKHMHANLQRILIHRALVRRRKFCDSLATAQRVWAGLRTRRTTADL